MIKSKPKVAKLNIGRSRNDDVSFVLVYAENDTPTPLDDKQVQIIFEDLRTGANYLIKTPSQYDANKAIVSLTDVDKTQIRQDVTGISIRIEGVTVAKGNFTWSAEFSASSANPEAIGINYRTLDETVEWFEVVVGPKGKDAYTYAVEHGFDGTEEDFGEAMAGLSEARDEAEAAKEDAEEAKQDAETAKGFAESARDAAILAKNGAEGAKDTAVLAANTAVSAKEDAEEARNEAILAKEAAELAASTIDGSGEVAEGNNKLVTGGVVWENTPRMGSGKNLFNVQDRQVDKYVVVNSANILTALNWECSGFIPVEPGNYYLSGEKYREGVGFYDSEKTPLRYSNINTGLIQVFENEAFVVFNLKSSSSGSYTNVQFEKGDSPTTYQPYKKTVIADEVEGLVDALTFVSASGNSLGLYTSLKDGALSVHTIDGATVRGDTKQKSAYGYSRVFNFTGDFVGGHSRTLTDDVAPLHIWNGTYGGNHGLNAHRATITDHGFTNVDIGTEFDKEGVKFYLMSVIDNDNAVFLSEYSGDSLLFSFTPLTNGILSRGAENYTITDVAPFVLYSLDDSLSIDVFVDGYRYDEINTNCKIVDVVEKYTLSNPPSILDAVISRAGQDEPPSFSGSVDVQIENIYQFRRNVVLVFNSFRTLNEVKFKDIMAVQAVKLHDTLTEYYIPNSNELNESVDLRKPTVVSWSSSIPSTYVVVDEMPDPLNPPHRVIMYYGNSGIMIGYLLDRGVGADITSYTNRTFEIRNNTGKIYPHTVESTVVGSIIPANTVYSSAMYRAYTDLSKTRSGNRLSVFEVPVDDSVFVYIDYSGSMVDCVQLQNTGFSGRKIEVIESKNTQCLSDVYTGSISVIASYVEGETCYLILKL